MFFKVLVIPRFFHLTNKKEQLVWGGGAEGYGICVYIYLLN